VILWIILTSIVAGSVAILTVPLVRRYDARPLGSAAMRSVLTDQLADIDNQQRAGTVSPPEAEALRIETKRRLLMDTVEERPPRALGSGALGQIAVAVAVLVTLGGTLLYSRLGSPETPITGAADDLGSATVASGTTGAGDPAVTKMIAAIEDKLKTRPDDFEGWRLLGSTRYSLGQYAAAGDAYTRAATLAPTRGDLQSALGETLTLAANGTVTPIARAAFVKAVTADPGDARARYFLGVARDQAGDHAGAVNIWVAMLQSAPVGASWAADVRRTLDQVAREAGISLAGRLPADAAANQPTPPGTVSPTIGALLPPSASQSAAVQALAPDDQQTMIRQMVDRLAARLKTNPQDPDGWLRLIRVRMVQGDRPGAVSARDQALAALTKPDERAAVADGARALGVPKT